MIAVSNEFKQAIKNAERRIKGYVEVLYDVKTPTVNTSSNMTSSYTELSDIKQGGRVKQNYGTIDYLPLDGSYLTMDASNNTNSGFISDELSGANTGRTITLSFASTTLDGITIYYKNNLPEGAYLTLSDGTTATIPAPEENESGEYTQQYIFSSPKTLTSIIIQYDYWRYETRKVRIPRIDLGISAVYKNQDLIEFTVDEEVNKLVEEVPINETNVTINNMYDSFNPLNPQGVVKYLTEGSKITPYIGVLTETQGVEYVKMGDFFFDSYTNNSNKTTTLVGKNIIREVEKEELKDNNEVNVFISSMSKSLFQQFMNNYSYTFNTLDYESILATFNINKNKLIDFIREISFFNSTLFFANRNNQLNLKYIDSTIKDTLSKNELLKDVQYKKIDRINTLINVFPSGFSQEATSSHSVYETSVVLETSPQYVLCQSSTPDLMNCTLSQSGASSGSIISKGRFLCFVKLTGTIGNTVSIQLNSTEEVKESINSVKKTIKSAGEKENAIEFESKLRRNISTINTLNYTPSYEISFEYNGDPSLEAGDYIQVETPYGYKPVFIQKNKFKFNGGLSGSIEGVE